MRLTTVILLATMIQVSASSFAQRLTFVQKNTTLERVFREIKKQTGYNVLWYAEKLKKAKTVDADFKNASIEKVLDEVLEGQPFTYNIDKKTIVIKEKEPSLIEKMMARFQEIDVRGRVVDEKGNGISGATIMVKGSNQSAISGIDGGFFLKDVDENSLLVISYVGYETKHIKATLNLGDITLLVNDNPLDEVQVIAYGTTSKRLSTGNISSIKAADIEKQPIQNPLLALQGRVPGIFISQNSGYAGSGVTVRVQGQNSLQYGNDPFYVVDGVPYISQLLPNSSGIQGGSGAGAGSPAGAGNPLSYLNPADIESIDVLKDADATAIYGSRAANGAILITTKKGNIGNTQVDAAVQLGAAKLGRRMKLLNTQQYLEMRKEAYLNDGREIPTTNSAKNFSNFDLTSYDQTRYTDWQDELMGGTAQYTDAQLSISGGSANTTFRVNGGFHNETTVLPFEFSNRKSSLGISLNHSSQNKKFELHFSGTYQNDDNKLPFNDQTPYFMRLAPNAPALRNPDGSLNWARIETDVTTQDSISTWTNPLSYYLNTYHVKTNNIISSINLSYLLAKGITFKTNLGFTDLITSDVVSQPLMAYSPESRINHTRQGAYSDGRNKSWIIEPQLTYDFQIDNGKATLLLGSTFQENSANSKSIFGTGYNSDEVIEDYHSASVLTTSPTVVNSLYRYSAVFGRFNYNWKEKYILSLTARRDGSSRFGRENRFENFGAVGAAWIFSNESLFETVSFLSFGKLRGSYGTTGSDQIGDYGYLNQYGNIIPTVPYQTFTGLQPAALPNPFLQWELTKKLQAGIDVGFIDGRTLLSINYYRNLSSNQLIDYSLPSQTGFSGILQNFPAKIENKGWEFTLSSENIRQKNFSWFSNINLTIHRNRLLEFDGIEKSSFASKLIIGEPIAIFRAFKFAGVNEQTGLYQYLAADGKVVNIPDYQKDLIIPVNLAPKFYGGFQNSVIYKDFSLDFLFQFSKQNAVNNKTGFGYQLGGNGNQPIQVMNRWQNLGDQTNVQKYSTYEYLFDVQNSTLMFSDASYIRLKNVSLSYSIPLKITKSLYLQRCSFFAQAQNLITVTNYSGLDPETPGSGTLPPMKTVTVGVKVSL